MNKEYYFRNAKAEKENHPDTVILSDEQLATIKLGDAVKIALEGSHAGQPSEPFWLIVWFLEENYFVGEVSSSLLHSDYHGVLEGDMLQVHSNNILNIMHRNSKELVIPLTPEMKLVESQGISMLFKKKI